MLKHKATTRSFLATILFVALAAVASPAQAGKGKGGGGAVKPPPPGAAVNACGCYKDNQGICFCAKKGKCACPGDCEPAGCEEKRAKEMDKEMAAEMKKAKEQDKKNAADAEKAANAPPGGDKDAKTGKTGKGDKADSKK